MSDGVAVRSEGPGVSGGSSPMETRASGQDVCPQLRYLVRTEARGGDLTGSARAFCSAREPSAINTLGSSQRLPPTWWHVPDVPIDRGPAPFEKPVLHRTHGRTSRHRKPEGTRWQTAFS